MPDKTLILFDYFFDPILRPRRVPPQPQVLIHDDDVQSSPGRFALDDGKDVAAALGRPAIAAFARHGTGRFSLPASQVHPESEVLRGNDILDSLKRFIQTLYNLVLLDESMPGMEGDKVFEYLREFSKVPVAFISGFLTPTKEKKVMAMGAVKCLRKPVELDQVKSLIQAVTSSARH